MTPAQRRSHERGACECLDLAFDAIRVHMESHHCTLAEAMHHFGVGEQCAGCVADAMLALGGTEKDMHEFFVLNLPEEPQAR